MSVLALLLLLLVTVVPAALAVLRRGRPGRRDPVLPVAAAAVVLVAGAAVLAAEADPVSGWRLAAAYVLGVAAATSAGSVVVRALFRMMRGEWRSWWPASQEEPAHGPAEDRTDDRPAVDDRTPPPERRAVVEPEPPETVLRGGAWIGYLERAAVSATVLAGWPEGIALVLAVKGVGRYSELRGDDDAPEAFIIGTLASLLWAGAATGTAHLLR